jgi:hypothetical protein
MCETVFRDGIRLTVRVFSYTSFPKEKFSKRRLDIFICIKDPAAYVPYKILPKDVQQTEEYTTEN